ncbi:hypothetical protein [Natroniella sp. ANB-PHB2]|uniref:hypothetical protein n=1 Tax=Natroniella sp. ANB-PHB2 TaxID=3384444 RepID=UPI0038D4DACC
MTEIEDEEVLQFMIDAIIKKIERIIGYSLAREERTEYIKGVNTEYLWLKRKPVSEVAGIILFNEELTEDEYQLRSPEDRPYLKLKDRVVPTSEEAEVTYTAGFESGELDSDIELLIFNLINDFRSNLEDGDIKSYSFAKISVKFTSYMEKQENLYSQITEVFGVVI